MSTTETLNRHERVVALTRFFDAPRERVFECWTRAEHLAHWFGPKAFTIHSVEADARPGGVFRLCMRSPDGVINVTFAESGGRTKLSVNATAAGASDVAAGMLKGMDRGWAETIDRLGSRVAN